MESYALLAAGRHPLTHRRCQISPIPQRHAALRLLHALRLLLLLLVLAVATTAAGRHAAGVEGWPARRRGCAVRVEPGRVGMPMALRRGNTAARASDRVGGGGGGGRRRHGGLLQPNRVPPCVRAPQQGGGLHRGMLLPIQADRVVVVRVTHGVLRPLADGRGRRGCAPQCVRCPGFPRGALREAADLGVGARWQSSQRSRCGPSSTSTGTTSSAQSRSSGKASPTTGFGSERSMNRESG